MVKKIYREGKLVIVTGIPGVGKTTVLNSTLAICNESGIEIKYINYGDLMFEEATAKGLVKDRDEMRRLTISDQISLQLNAACRISVEAEKHNVLLDTHMFIRTNDGYMPGLPVWIAESIMPDSIVLLEADPESISKRRRKDADIRIREEDSPQKINEHQMMGRAGAASLAILTGCTVLIVENKEGEYQSAGQAIASLFRR
ncbi:MAG: adenylate kinase [Candidatus Methanomethylicaceae archaeon]